MLGRCYSMTVEYHRERMVINEQAADEPQESPLWEDKDDWLWHPYGKNHKTLNPWPTQ